MANDDKVARQGTGFGPAVLSVVGPVQQDETRIDDVLRIQEANERVIRLRTLLDAWTIQQREERRLRRSYAIALMVLLWFEVLAIFAAFFLVAAGAVHAEKWMVTTFLVVAFLQSAGLVLVVVKYLFPDRGSQVLQLVEAETHLRAS